MSDDVPYAGEYLLLLLSSYECVSNTLLKFNLGTLSLLLVEFVSLFRVYNSV